jgi:hypothetical protein
MACKGEGCQLFRVRVSGRPGGTGQVHQFYSSGLGHGANGDSVHGLSLKRVKKVFPEILYHFSGSYLLIFSLFQFSFFQFSFF